MSAEAAFARLCLLLAQRFQAEPRGGAREASVALRAAANAEPQQCVDASPPPVLEAAAALPGALPEAQLALECAPLLAWSNWGEGALAEDTAKGLWTAELVGPDGAVRERTVRVGLLVSDRGIDYPRSSHAGEETYLALAGTAQWTVGDEPYQSHPPGAFIHHPSWVPHGRRTGDEPFLGAWRWSGDLDLSKFRLQEAT